MLPQELKMKRKPCAFYALFKYKNQSIKSYKFTILIISYTGKQLRDEFLTFDNRDRTHGFST